MPKHLELAEELLAGADGPDFDPDRIPLTQAAGDDQVRLAGEGASDG